MMIGPEMFYEMELKGKSAEAIQAKIRGLKNKMGRLKSDIKSQKTSFEPVSQPSPATKLACYRLYLARAKQALIDAGGEYPLSQREKSIQSFDESLPFIEQINFTYGGYLQGCEQRTLSFSGDNLSLKIDHMRRESNEMEPIFKEFPSAKTDFLEAFASLHIGEWKSEYNNYGVLDGSFWSLEIRFNNGHKTVRKTGSNAFPYNFYDFYELMQCEGNDDFSGE